MEIAKYFINIATTFVVLFIMNVCFKYTLQPTKDGKVDKFLIKAYGITILICIVLAYITIDKS